MTGDVGSVGPRGQGRLGGLKVYEFGRPQERRSLRGKPEVWDLFKGLAETQGLVAEELRELG